MTDHSEIGERAIAWAIGISIGNIAFGISSPWGPIVALFIIGICYLGRGAIE